MKKILFFCLAIALLLGGTSAAEATFFSDDENPTVGSEINDDAFVAGDTVSINAPILGELFVAGSKLSLTQRPGRSVFAAGNVVNVERGATYNAFVAGNTITLDGEYGNDVYVAGNDVTIKDGTVIHGDLRVAASTITLGGRVEGKVQASSESLTSHVVVNGSVDADVVNLTFTGGSIGQGLTYTAKKEAKGLDKVAVTGKVVRNEPAATSQAKQAGFNEIFRNWLFTLLSSLLIGAGLILFVPKKLQMVSENFMANWGRNFLIGILALFVTPILIVLLFVTLIGWPIALALLLVYIALLLIVPTLGAIAFGRWLLGRAGDENPTWWASLLVGSVLISILSFLPVIGWSLGTIAFIGLTIPALGAVLSWYRKQVA